METSSKDRMETKYKNRMKTSSENGMETSRMEWKPQEWNGNLKYKNGMGTSS